MIRNNNIPKHWQLKKLGEVCNVLDNLRKPINSTERQQRISGKSQGELYPYYGATGQVGWIDDFLTDGEFILIGEDGAPFLDNYKDKAYKIKGKTWVNNHAHILKGKEQFLLDDFALYYLNSINYREFVNGTTRLKLTKSSLVEIPFVVPPLPEQQAIVAKIEELLSELENGKQQLITAQQQLKVYRQSLLKCAFEGKLTKHKGEWKKLKFGEIAIAVDPHPSHRTPPIVPNGIPYISIKDFDSELDKIDLTNARKVSSDVLKEHLNRYTLQGGDFVIGKIGTIGKPVRVILPQNYSLSANIVLIQPRKVNPTYLYYFFQSNQIEKAFKAGTNATTQAAFGIQKVRELQIDLPNEKEQQLIIDELESKLTVCDKIQEIISQSLLQAETLRQSILKKAFEGKLITTEKIEEVNELR
jgi:type I restriction enzyme S subunit